MEQVVPWQKLCALIEPFYPQAGNGRPPVGVERMLRMYFLQQWFNLSDPAVEDAVYESPVMRAFVGIDLGRSRRRTKPRYASSATCWRRTTGGRDAGDGQPVPGKQGLADQHGNDCGRHDYRGAEFDEEPAGERDPEMKQTKKGGQWYFGMKAHVGVDSRTKMIHRAVVTAAKRPMSRCCRICCTGKRARCGATRATWDKPRVIAEVAPGARDFINRRCRYHGS